jgi:branched-chain amino acid transport system substrate-binding protein
MLSKKISQIIVGLMLASLLLSACGGDKKEDKNDKKKLLIGGTLCITGIQSALDLPGSLGAQLAVEELNRQGGVLGREVEFVNIDGASDPETVRSAAQQLIKQGAVALVAPCDFDFGSPAAQEAQKAGIVSISTCASSPLYNSQVLGDKQFTLSIWNTTMGATAAEYAYRDQGWKSAYVITDTFLAYTTSLSRYFSEDFASLGGEIIGEDTYTQGNGDFSAQLERLKALPQQPDVLYISSYMPDLAMIINLIRDAGIETPIMGGDSYDDPALFAALGAKNGNNIIFVTHGWMQPESNQNMSHFLELYQAKYGKPADTAFVATGWDVVMVLAQAMKAAGTTDGAKVAHEMEITEFNLLTGKLKWSSANTGHEPDKEAALVQVQGGVTAFIGWGRPTNVPKP